MKLAICSLGDPLSPRTWSGTPANLCRTLGASGNLGTTLDTETYASRWSKLLLKIISKSYYAGSRYVRLGRLERAWRARYVHAALPPDGIVTDILHLCTHDLPVVQDRSTHPHCQRHYLFIDGTWDLWRKYATDQASVAKRLSNDIDALDRDAYHAVHHIFTIAEYVRQNLITSYGVPAEKITTVGSGRGSIRPYHGAKDYTNGQILFVAKERFEDKGGKNLLAGFALAHRENPSLHLVLVGREEYSKMAAQQPGITAYGHVSLAQLQSLFEQATLFAMPAMNEPWGLVYLEALSCRVPVLGLQRLSLPEITCDGKHGFCLETAEPSEIARALIRAYADPPALADMGTSGQAYCLGKFTWERTTRLITQTVARLQRDPVF